MGLSMVAVFLFAGSMSTSSIVGSQNHWWNIIPLFPSFCIYAVAVVGETNRAPFDLPEAESELVGGFHTEYSSFKFAMFFLAEYINMVTVSALATTLFLGGWRAPWPLSLWHGANSGWWPFLWFVGKVVAIIFVFVWLRGTLPRLRYDQFMHFGWKALLPLNLGWILAITTARVLYDRGRPLWAGIMIAAAGMLVVLLIAYTVYDSARIRRQQDRADDDEADAMLTPTFPTPPMDLVVPSPLRTQRYATTSARPSTTQLTEGDADG
jgi:NADH-quinone oxidoreductase subunit H